MKNDRKINLFMLVLNLDVGGLERLIIDMVKKLDIERYNITLCTLGDGGSLASNIDTLKIKFVCLNKPDGLKLSTVQQIAKLLKLYEIDIIHTHNKAAHLYGVLARILCFGKMKLVHTKHGRDVPHTPRSIYRNRICSIFSSKIISVSNDVKDVCINIEKVNPSKVETIVNGLDLEPYLKMGNSKRESDELVIGHVARLSEVKNQPLLLRVFSKFLTQYPHAKLRFVGDGSERKRLEDLAVDLKISENVEFLGMRNDIPELIEGFNWFVLSSFSEGTPLAVIEAMAASCPVVSTSVGGLIDLIQDGKTGFLVHLDDEEEMLSKWNYLAENRQRCLEMGKAARDHVCSSFQIDTMLNKYCNLYESLMH